MPFRNKRKRGVTKINNQKNQIKKKLMEISLKVDYYIYKNKSMSVADATSYYHEIMSYQDLCKHDARSLQVIEKLSRFMIAIIKEQTGHADNIDINAEYTQDIDNDRVSPVYSMTEEDVNILEFIHSQDTRKTVCFTELENNMDVVEESIQNINFSNEPQREAACKINTFSGNTLTNMNKEEDKNSGDLDEEITMSIVDLTIDDGDNTNTYVDNGLHSQSILNNFVHPGTQNLSNLYVDQCGQDITEVDREINSIILKEHKKNVHKTIHLNTAKENSLDLTQVDPTGITRELKYTQNMLMNKSGTEQLKKQEKRSYKNPVKQRKLQNNMNTVKKTKQDDSTTNEKESHSNKGKQKKNGDRSKKIYKTEYSWLENMKFVRQIQVDEYDPSLASLGESLWDNCEIPLSWDDFD